MATQATVSIGGDVRQLERDISKALNRNYSIGLNSKNFSQPLGRITGQLGEFEKSLQASNARVIAFGASAGAIFAVQKALKATLASAILVEKQLADINVILGETTQGLNKFGNQLFKIAGETGRTFNEVSVAAAELARQGLGVEETLRRTKDALILTRLSGLETEKSVESLTATINSFAKAALTSTEIINKFAKVDAAFAVSSADLANAVARVGSAAQDAGVSFDQLIAIVTAAQQTTARGGAVIGNSFKTIFTRIQRPRVLDELERLGVSVRDLGGNTKPVIQILSGLAKTFDTLSSSQKSQISELVGGVFQINILKAALSDLNKEYSIYDKALNSSLTATDEAVKRNEKLNETLDSLINKTLANVTQVGSKIGKDIFGPSIKNVLGALNSALEFGAGEDGAESTGEKIAGAIFKGFGKFLAGPGLIIAGVAFTKIFAGLTKFSADALKTLLAVNSQTQNQREIQKDITTIISSHPEIMRKIYSGQLNVESASEAVLNIYKLEKKTLEDNLSLINRISKIASNRGIKPFSAATGKASGYVPAFAQEEAMAVSLGASKSVKAKMGKGTIGGKKFVMNDQEIEIPRYGRNGDSAVIPMYSRGYVPNYASAGGVGIQETYQYPFRMMVRGRPRPVKPDDVAKNSREYELQLLNAGLASLGFTDPKDLNSIFGQNVEADFLAKKNGVPYLIDAKAGYNDAKLNQIEEKGRTMAALRQTSKYKDYIASLGLDDKDIRTAIIYGNAQPSQAKTLKKLGLMFSGGYVPNYAAVKGGKLYDFDETLAKYPKNINPRELFFSSSIAKASLTGIGKSLVGTKDPINVLTARDRTSGPAIRQFLEKNRIPVNKVLTGASMFKSVKVEGRRGPRGLRSAEKKAELMKRLYGKYGMPLNLIDDAFDNIQAVKSLGIPGVTGTLVKRGRGLGARMEAKGYVPNFKSTGASASLSYLKQKIDLGLASDEDLRLYNEMSSAPKKSSAAFSGEKIFSSKFGKAVLATTGAGGYDISSVNISPKMRGKGGSYGLYEQMFKYLKKKGIKKIGGVLLGQGRGGSEFPFATLKRRLQFGQETSVELLNGKKTILRTMEDLQKFAASVSKEDIRAGLDVSTLVAGGYVPNFAPSAEGTQPTEPEKLEKTSDFEGPQFKKKGVNEVKFDGPFNKYFTNAEAARQLDIGKLDTLDAGWGFGEEGNPIKDNYYDKIKGSIRVINYLKKKQFDKWALKFFNKYSEVDPPENIKNKRIKEAMIIARKKAGVLARGDKGRPFGTGTKDEINGDINNFKGELYEMLGVKKIPGFKIAPGNYGAADFIPDPNKLKDLPDEFKDKKGQPIISGVEAKSGRFSNVDILKKALRAARAAGKSSKANNNQEDTFDFGKFALLKTYSSGYVPNFAADQNQKALNDAIGREASSRPLSTVRVSKSNAFKNPSNPNGYVVTNTKDEPNGVNSLFAGGYIPNYANKNSGNDDKDGKGGDGGKGSFNFGALGLAFAAQQVAAQLEVFAGETGAAATLIKSFGAGLSAGTTALTLFETIGQVAPAVSKDSGGFTKVLSKAATALGGFAPAVGGTIAVLAFVDKLADGTAEELARLTKEIEETSKNNTDLQNAYSNYSAALEDYTAALRDESSSPDQLKKLRDKVSQYAASVPKKFIGNEELFKQDTAKAESLIASKELEKNIALASDRKFSEGYGIFSNKREKRTEEVARKGLIDLIDPKKLATSGGEIAKSLSITAGQYDDIINKLRKEGVSIKDLTAEIQKEINSRAANIEQSEALINATAGLSEQIKKKQKEISLIDLQKEVRKANLSAIAGLGVVGTLKSSKTSQALLGSKALGKGGLGGAVVAEKALAELKQIIPGSLKDFGKKFSETGTSGDAKIDNLFKSLKSGADLQAKFVRQNLGVNIDSADIFSEIIGVEPTMKDLVASEEKLKESIDNLKKELEAKRTGVLEQMPFAGFKSSGFMPDSGWKNFERASARKLGAGNVTPLLSRGTIGGKKFFLNNKEIEIPGFGKNGDSAVIPTYYSGYVPYTVKSDDIVYKSILERMEVKRRAQKAKNLKYLDSMEALRKQPPKSLTRSSLIENRGPNYLRQVQSDMAKRKVASAKRDLNLLRGSAEYGAIRRLSPAVRLRLYKMAGYNPTSGPLSDSEKASAIMRVIAAYRQKYFRGQSMASGFIPNFAGGESLARRTEKSLTGTAIRSFDSRIGTYYRSAGQPSSLDALIKRDHPEGLSAAMQNSYAVQNGSTPNFANFEDISSRLSENTSATQELTERLNSYIASVEAANTNQTAQVTQAGGQQNLSVNLSINVSQMDTESIMAAVNTKLREALGNMKNGKIDTAMYKIATQRA